VKRWPNGRTTSGRLPAAQPVKIWNTGFRPRRSFSRRTVRIRQTEVDNPVIGIYRRERMKNRLVREIAKTIRALENFAIDWQKYFPESEPKASRIRARLGPKRRFAQILKLPPQLVAARGMNHINRGSRDWRVGKRRECVKKR
jgi:hypothetical protein